MKRARKQTSERVSRIAANLLKYDRFRGAWKSQMGTIVLDEDVTRDVKALAASCLSQDETKGQRGGLAPARPQRRKRRK